MTTGMGISSLACKVLFLLQRQALTEILTMLTSSHRNSRKWLQALQTLLPYRPILNNNSKQCIMRRLNLATLNSSV
jgi:hypothetical protein